VAEIKNQNLEFMSHMWTRVVAERFVIKYWETVSKETMQI